MKEIDALVAKVFGSGLDERECSVMTKEDFLDALLEARALAKQQDFIVATSLDWRRIEAKATAGRLRDFADLIEECAALKTLVAEQASTISGLAKREADLIERHAKLRKNLLDIQFSDSGYCPACSGWNDDPKDPKHGYTPGVHMKDCWLAAFCADFPKES